MQKDMNETSIQTVKLFREKKYDEALPFAEKAVTIAKKLYGEKHIEVANVLKNLGYIQLYNDDTDKAGDTFENTFDIYKDLKNLSKDDKNSAAAIAENLALIKSGKDLLTAKKYYEQAIIWREEANGGESEKLVLPLVGLANINYWNKDYKKSAELYEKAIRIGVNYSTADKTNFYAIFLKGQCAFRKADKSDEFEEISKEYYSKTSSDSGKNDQAVTTINGGVLNGKAKSLSKPVYSLEARRNNANGKVNVDILINENGDVISACSEKNANPYLAVSSEVSAYESKFAPTTLKGKPVTVTGQIVYNYVP